MMDGFGGIPCRSMVGWPAVGEHGRADRLAAALARPPGPPPPGCAAQGLLPICVAASLLVTIDHKDGL